jgi:hypothetical protein
MRDLVSIEIPRISMKKGAPHSKDKAANSMVEVKIKSKNGLN